MIAETLPSGPESHPGPEGGPYAYHAARLDFLHPGYPGLGHEHGSAALLYGPAEPSDRPGYDHRHPIRRGSAPTPIPVEPEPGPCRNCGRPFEGDHVYLDLTRSTETLRVEYRHRLVCRFALDDLPEYDPDETP